MPTIREPDDLDLPPLDDEGDGEADASLAEGELSLDEEPGDPLDDATGELDPPEELAVDGGEAGWLLDAEDAAGLDVGPFDLSLGGEIASLDEDDRDDGDASFDLVGVEETALDDLGEEGPLGSDEELREEDLPALDADEEGDVDDAGLYDRSMLVASAELRWEDRAWARAALPGPVDDGAEDSGVLAVPGDDARNEARDATWRSLDEGGRLTAAAFVPGGSVVVALAAVVAAERPLLVRVLPSGDARIIAEIEEPAADGPGRVTSLRWDAALGCLVAVGTFGVQAFRPA